MPLQSSALPTELSRDVPYMCNFHEWYLGNNDGEGRKKKELAADGFDPSTSGLWAQHASTAPRCSTEW